MGVEDKDWMYRTPQSILREKQALNNLRGRKFQMCIQRKEERQCESLRNQYVMQVIHN